MTLYKKISVDNFQEIQKELSDFDWFNANPDVVTDTSPLTPVRTSSALFLSFPELPKLLCFLENNLNIETITHFHIINVPSNDSLQIHIDKDDCLWAFGHHEYDDCLWAFNIPIKNCENSYTIFYEDDQSEICRVKVDTPCFLKVKEKYHQVINYGDKPRLVMTIRFNKKNLDEIVKSHRLW